MSIPTKLKVDFSLKDFDLVTDGLDKVLACFYDACTLRKFYAAIINQIQQLYNEAVKVQEKRTLFEARGVQLDGIGRIVGQDRKLWYYSTDNWFHFDTVGLGWDQADWWCKNAPLIEYTIADDDNYQSMILARIVKNHTLVASVPEILSLIKLFQDVDVSFIKCGPNSVNLVVPEHISKTQLWYIINRISDTRVDDTYMIPYPVTLWLCDKIYFIPENPFHFDRDEPFQWDYAPWAVGARLR